LLFFFVPIDLLIFPYKPWAQTAFSPHIRTNAQVSEGLDFKDRNGRAVLIAGIPYAYLRDGKVMAKREYMNKQASNWRTGNKLARQRGELTPADADLSPITGDEWYTISAARAVNQALGRVIRHVNDYGAMIFLDERFANHDTQRGLSSWIRPEVREFDRFEHSVPALKGFFDLAARQPFARHSLGGGRPRDDGTLRAGGAALGGGGVGGGGGGSGGGRGLTGGE
jgi:regulator of telomere elongation helicase 1